MVMRWWQKKKAPNLHFADAACFNWALDTNQALRDGIARLAEQFSQLTEEEYTNQALTLFRQAGLDLTGEELKMLLALRRETDRMLQQNNRKEE